jgi:hypothetical protein
VLSQNCERRLLTSSCPSVCPSAWNNSAPTGRIFSKFDIWAFLENLSRKFKFRLNRTIITGTLREDRYTFVIIPRSFLLRMRNVWDKCCRENQNAHFVLNNFYRKSRRLWDNVEKYGIGQTGRIWQYGACALHVGYLRLQTHTRGICNPHCFSTATVATGTQLSVTLYVYCLTCYNYVCNCKNWDYRLAQQMYCKSITVKFS